MIERIAIVLRDHDAPPNKPYIKWEAYTTLAKMILEVIQEPTKSMVEAGHEIIPDNRGYSNDAAAVYKAMIEAAFVLDETSELQWKMECLRHYSDKVLFKIMD